MSTAASITTAEQLLKSPDLGRCELVQGTLVMMSPAGFEHGRIVMRISRPLANHVEQTRSGVVLGAETGFLIARNPDTVRAPDVAFLRADRVPAAPLRGYFEGAPDLSVEVLSPDDRRREVDAKIAEWLHAGCTEVWVVNPQRRTIAIHRPSEVRAVRENETLSSPELLPGFSLPLSEVFRESSPAN